MDIKEAIRQVEQEKARELSSVRTVPGMSIGEAITSLENEGLWNVPISYGQQDQDDETQFKRALNEYGVPEVLHTPLRYIGDWGIGFNQTIGRGLINTTGTALGTLGKASESIFGGESSLTRAGQYLHERDDDFQKLVSDTYRGVAGDNPSAWDRRINSMGTAGGYVVLGYLLGGLPVLAAGLSPTAALFTSLATRNFMEATTEAANTVSDLYNQDRTRYGDALKGGLQSFIANAPQDLLLGKGEDILSSAIDKYIFPGTTDILKILGRDFLKSHVTEQFNELGQEPRQQAVENAVRRTFESGDMSWGNFGRILKEEMSKFPEYFAEVGEDTAWSTFMNTMLLWPLGLTGGGDKAIIKEAWGNNPGLSNNQVNNSAFADILAAPSENRQREYDSVKRERDNLEAQANKIYQDYGTNLDTDPEAASRLNDILSRVAAYDEYLNNFWGDTGVTSNPVQDEDMNLFPDADELNTPQQETPPTTQPTIDDVTPPKAPTVQDTTRETANNDDWRLGNSNVDEDSNAGVLPSITSLGEQDTFEDVQDEPDEELDETTESAELRTKGIIENKTFSDLFEAFNQSSRENTESYSQSGATDKDNSRVIGSFNFRGQSKTYGFNVVSRESRATDRQTRMKGGRVIQLQNKTGKTLAEYYPNSGRLEFDRNFERKHSSRWLEKLKHDFMSNMNGYLGASGWLDESGQVKTDGNEGFRARWGERMNTMEGRNAFYEDAPQPEDFDAPNGSTPRVTVAQDGTVTDSTKRSSSNNRKRGIVGSIMDALTGNVGDNETYAQSTVGSAGQEAGGMSINANGQTHTFTVETGEFSDKYPEHKKYFGRYLNIKDETGKIIARYAPYTKKLQMAEGYEGLKSQVEQQIRKNLKHYLNTGGFLDSRGKLKDDSNEEYRHKYRTRADTTPEGRAVHPNNQRESETTRKDDRSFFRRIFDSAKEQAAFQHVRRDIQAKLENIEGKEGNIRFSKEDAKYYSYLYAGRLQASAHAAGMRINDLYKIWNLKFEFEITDKPERGNTTFNRGGYDKDGNFNPAETIVKLFGNVITDKNGNKFIRINADVSTLIHEGGHIFLDDLRDLMKLENIPVNLRQDWVTLTKWLGVSDIDLTQDTSRMTEEERERWTNAQEKFAVAFEQYTATGQAPKSWLKRAFEAFKRWLSTIYGAIRNIKYAGQDGYEHEIEISPEIKAVFDRMFEDTYFVPNPANAEARRVRTGTTGQEYYQARNSRENYSQSVRQNIEHGTEAMNKVISEQTDVMDAMYRDDLGSISFLWGTPGSGAKLKHGWGISHLIARRNQQGYNGEAIARKMVDVIANGDIVRRYGENVPNGARVDINYDGHTAVLSLYKDGEKFTWLLTGFKNEENPVATGEGNGSSRATLSEPMRTRPEEGAGNSADSVAGKSEAVNKRIRRTNDTLISPEEIERYEQLALHGTGHIVRGGFKLQNIGTGEGAQVYGYGLYFAESPVVANTYRRMGLAAKDVRRVILRTKDGTVYSSNDTAHDLEYGQLVALREFYSEAATTPNAGLEDIRQTLLNTYRQEEQEQRSKLDEYRKELESSSLSGRLAAKAKINSVQGKLKTIREKIRFLNTFTDFSIEGKAGNIYKADIPENDVLLDWDANDQPEKVRKAMDKILKKLTEWGIETDRLANAKTGEEFYRGLQEALKPLVEKRRIRSKKYGVYTRPDMAASMLLNQAGVPGLRYWDGDSRDAQEGTHNFVIWNTDMIKMLGITEDSDSDAKAAFKEEYSVQRDNSESYSQSASQDNEAVNSEAQAWHEAVDKVLSGEIGQREHIKVMETPKVFTLIGAKTLPVYMDASKIHSILDKHPAITPEIIKQIPAAITDPIAIFSSATHPNDSIVVMTEIMDKDGGTVIVPVQMDVEQDSYQINRIASVFAKKNDKTGQVHNEWFTEQVNSGRLLYLNKNKSSRWSNQTGLQLSVGSSNENLQRSIPDENDLARLTRKDNEPVNKQTAREISHFFGNTKNFVKPEDLERYNQPDRFHGSGYKLENGEFDISKIGSGEGGQAFGYGIYIAQARGVAETYRGEGLRHYGLPPTIVTTTDGQTYTAYNDRKWSNNPSRSMERVLRSIGQLIQNNINADFESIKSTLLNKYQQEISNIPRLRRKFEERLRQATTEIERQEAQRILNLDPDIIREIQQDIEALNSISDVKIGEAKNGNIYNVDILADEETELLDWDKRFDEQPEKVRKAIEKIANKLMSWGLMDSRFGASETGEQIYHTIEAAINNMLEAGGNLQGYPFGEITRGDMGASLMFNNYGIPGLRYFDKWSRDENDGTRNFVIWDTNKLKVTGLTEDSDNDAKEYFKKTQKAKTESYNQIRRTNDTLISPEEIERYEQLALHGTGHIVRGGFKLQNIGSGQGAQAYGYGIYFAQNPEVAESYRLEGLDDLGIPEVTITTADGKTYSTKGDYSDIDDMLEEVLGDIETAVDFFGYKRMKDIKHHVMSHYRTALQGAQDDEIAYSNQIGQLKSPQAKRKVASSLQNARHRQQLIQKQMELLDSLKDIKVGYKKHGNIYKVDIPENDVLLDWDANDQPEKVRKAMDKILKKLSEWGIETDRLANARTGREFYRGLMNTLKPLVNKGRIRSKKYGVYTRPDMAASMLLNQAGVPGLRYWDGDSRGIQEGTHNFVVWNTDMIKMLGITEDSDQEAKDAFRSEYEELDTPQKQLDKVRAQYEGTAQWLKAPNGKDTNLTERQWLQVRTPNFKRWFGDWEKHPEHASKVLDANGEPLVVIHISRQDNPKGYSVFNTNGDFSKDGDKTLGTGAWFADFKGEENVKKSAMMAGHSIDEEGRNIYHVFLNFRNPFIYDAEGKRWQRVGKVWIEDKFGERIYHIDKGRYKGKPFSNLRQANEYIRDYLGNDHNRYSIGHDPFQTSDDLVRMVRQGKVGNGNHDGVIINNLRDMSVWGVDDYIAFNPNEIKSSTKNNGNFDVNNDEIYSQSISQSDKFTLSEEAQRQMSDIRSKYEGTNEWMTAPNGKKSNLSENQWLAVRTPNFKQWFGDWENNPDEASKILDVNGEPLIVYHGTSVPVDQIRTFERGEVGWLGPGIYLTPFKEYANQFSDKGEDGIMPLFLNLRKPLTLNSTWRIGRPYLELLQKLYGEQADDIYQERYDAVAERDKDILAGMPNEAKRRQYIHRRIVTGDEINQLLSQGYDGINWDDGEYSVLEPNQVKSATKNNGDFSRSKNEIYSQSTNDQTAKPIDDFLSPEGKKQAEEVRRQYEGTDMWLKASNGQKSNLPELQWLQVRTPNFKQWFGDWENDPDNASKILDANGEPMVVYHGSAKGGFSVFDTKGKNHSKGAGVFFSSSKNVASSYIRGKVSNDKLYPVFLNVRTPYVMDCGNKSWISLREYHIFDKFNNRNIFVKKDGTNFSSQEDAADYIRRTLHDPNNKRYSVSQSDFMTTDEVARFVWGLKKGNSKRFDGVILNSINDIGSVVDGAMDTASDNFIVITPSQIKSATRNNGDFSRSNDEIYKQSANDTMLKKYSNILERSNPESINPDNLSTNNDGFISDDMLERYNQANPDWQDSLHGTGHILEGNQFDLSKVGTGEGGQYRGWGIYSAQARGVAETYRRFGLPESGHKLSVSFNNGATYTTNPNFDYEDARYWGLPFDEEGDTLDDEALWLVLSEINDFVNETLEELEDDNAYISIYDIKKRLLRRWQGILERTQNLKQGQPGFNSKEHSIQRAEKVIELLNSISSFDKQKLKGNIYPSKVRGNDFLLDWDANLDDGQSQHVQSAIYKIRTFIRRLADLSGISTEAFDNSNTGGALYMNIVGIMKQYIQKHPNPRDGVTQAKKRTSLLFNRFGVPGLRFFDRFSRAKQEGTRNFVVWNEDAIKVLGIDPSSDQDAIDYFNRYKAEHPDGFIGSDALEQYDQLKLHATGHIIWNNRFDLQYKGSGEGGAAYGHGAYFAENPDVADSYRRFGLDNDNIGSPIIETDNGSVDTDNPIWQQIIIDVQNEANDKGITTQKELIKAVKEYYRYRLHVAKQNKKSSGGFAASVAKKEIKAFNEKLELLNTITKLEFPNAKNGNVYTFDIPEDYELLDWDKSLYRQPKEIRPAIKEAVKFLRNVYKSPASVLASTLADNYSRSSFSPVMAKQLIQEAVNSAIETYRDSNKTVYAFALERLPQFKDIASFIDAERYLSLREAVADIINGFNVSKSKGENLYWRLAAVLGSNEEASKYLNSLGIPGHRYWDRQSRTIRRGTHNYVIWNMDKVNMVGISEDSDKDAIDYFNRTHNEQFSKDFASPEQVEQYEQLRLHGTGHIIWNNRFDLQFTGSGEGGAAFGHGIYFAEHPDVANSYRREGLKNGGFGSIHISLLGGKSFNTDGYHSWSNNPDDDTLEVLHAIEDGVDDARTWGKTPNKERIIRTISKGYRQDLRTMQDNLAKGLDALNSMKKGSDDYNSLNDDISTVREIVQSLKNKLAFIKSINSFTIDPTKNGNIYTADIPEDYDLLDWDASLSAQSPKIKKAINEAVNFLREHNVAATSGETLYWALADVLGSDVEASNYLNSLGIPGHRYFDKFSRDNQQGTHNYVIWNTEKISITDISDDSDEDAKDYFRQHQSEQYSQIIGTDGARRLDELDSNTTRMDNLNIARQMEQQGQSPRKLWLATGWMRGVDGKWRYELPDGKLNTQKLRQLKKDFVKFSALADEFDNNPTFEFSSNDVEFFNSLENTVYTSKLPDVFDAPELFRAYPQLLNVGVAFDDELDDGTLGEFEPAMNSIFINPNHPDTRELRKTIIHEVQHAIQSIEGFAVGASPDTLRAKYHGKVPINPFMRRNLKLQEGLLFKALPKELKKKFVTLRKKEHSLDKTAFSKLLRDTLTSDERKRYSAWRDIQEKRKNVGKINRRLTPQQAYYLVAGEVEARNAETRSNWGERRRMATPLDKSEDDFDRDSQIALDDFGNAFVSDELIEHYDQLAWHGSPNIINDNRFNLKYVGTGEGNQAYGYGIYLAQDKQVAESYRTAGLTDKQKDNVIIKTKDGKDITSVELQGIIYNNSQHMPKQDALALFQFVNWIKKFAQGNFSSIDETVDDFIRSRTSYFVKHYGENSDSLAKHLRRIIQPYIPVDAYTRNIPKGNLYSADIPEDFELLDWDADMKHQPEQVLVRLKNAGLYSNDSETGQELYLRMSRQFGSGKNGDKQASMALNNAGIPGHRYFDAGSRNDKNGTHNFVIWNTDTLQLLGISDDSNEDAQDYYRAQDYYNARMDSLDNDSETYDQLMLRGTRFNLNGDLSYRGKGNGNSYYGAGVYLAESRATAEHFRLAGYDDLERVTFSDSNGNTFTYKETASGFTQDFLKYLAENELKRDRGDKRPTLHEAANTYIQQERERLNAYQKLLDKAKREAKDNPEKASYVQFRRGLLNMQKKKLAAIEANIPASLSLAPQPKGNVYSFDGPENYELLDWDAPVSEQSNKIIQALRQSRLNLPDNVTGGEFYKALSDKFGGGEKGDKKASAWLNKKDIPGLRYLNDYIPEAKGTHDFNIWNTQLLKFLGVEGDAEASESYNQTIGEHGARRGSTYRSVDDIAPEQQIEQVRRQYQGTDKWMKAPNGQDTKLTERQWLQVRTPSFKRWFGDWEHDPKNASKVVDENGEPLVVYHGTPDGGFSIFEMSGRSGIYTHDTGAWFTSSNDGAKYYAKQYGGNAQIYPVFLNIRNPYIHDALGADWDELAEVKIKDADGRTVYIGDMDTHIGNEDEAWDYINEYLLRDEYGNLIDNEDEEGNPLYTVESNGYENTDDIVRAVWSGDLGDGNHDGVIFRDVVDPDDAIDVFVTRTPENIKSATDNNGNFDHSNPDIYYQTANNPQIYSDNFKAWFGDWENDPEHSSKIVDKNGKPRIVYHATGSEFSKFQSGNYSGTIYFALSKAGAKRAARAKKIIMPCYLSVKNPVNSINNPMNWYDAEDNLKVSQWKRQGFDGIFVRDEAGISIAVFYPAQIKSVTNNNGNFDPSNPDIYYQTANDKRYFDALNSGDTDTAKSIIDTQAKLKGYSPDNEHRMNHRPADSHDGDNPNMADVMNSDFVPQDYWTHPEHYQHSPEDYEAFYAVTNAIKRHQPNITVYRAVPGDVREDTFRNGDWVSPSRSYAQLHAKSHVKGSARIISQSVPLEHLWWDGNSITEWGYDDGQNYSYRNTKNNRKLNDTITYDNNGDIVPPSKRFDYRRSETYYQRNPNVQHFDTFSNPETEAAYSKRSKLNTPDGAISRISQATNDFLHGLKGDFPDLAGNDNFTFAREILRKMNRQTEAKAMMAVQTLDASLKGLSKKQYNIFARLMLINDLYTFKRHNPDAALPLGFTPETLKAERVRFSNLAQSDTAIMKAINAEHEAHTAIQKQLVDRAQKLNMSKFAEKARRYDFYFLDYARMLGGEDINANYVMAVAETRNEYLQDIERMDALLELRSKHDIKHELEKQFGKDWQKHIPEGYKIFNPLAGRFIKSAHTLTENILDMAMEQSGKQNSISNDAIQAFRLKLSDNSGSHLLVLPTELADTLSNMDKPRMRGPVGKILKAITTGWKKYVLFFPLRAFKYNVRNMTGDLDAAIAGNPHSLTFLRQAMSELWDVYYGNRSNITPELREFQKRGGAVTIQTTQELGDYKQLKEFQNLMDDMQDKDLAAWRKLPKKLWGVIDKFAWTGIQNFSDFREQWLRYACYLSYLHQMQHNNGTPNNWGASRKNEVLALPDIRDRAFKMSNELLGAYDQVTDTGKYLRDIALPFYSWLEVNAKRYYQLIRNGITEDNSGDFASRFLKGQLANTPYYAFKLGKTYLMVNLLSMLIAAFNHLVWPDDEDKLPPDIQGRPHITLGHDTNGNVLYFDRVGAMLDNLEWFGQDNSPFVPFANDIKEIFDGRQTFSGFIGKVASAPVNKAVNALNPFFKLPAELLSGKSFYPEAVNPRNIRSNAQYVAQSLGLNWPYKVLTGQPRNDWQEFKNVFTYSANADEAAYFYTLSKVREFQENVLHKRFDGFASTQRGEALRNMKTALRLGDNEAAQRYLREYYGLGGSRQGLKTSMRAVNPLSALSKAEQKQFLKWLSPDDRKYLNRAERFFHNMADKFLR